jgi:hypothetical protein
VATTRELTSSRCMALRLRRALGFSGGPLGPQVWVSASASCPRRNGRWGSGKLGENPRVLGSVRAPANFFFFWRSRAAANWGGRRRWWAGRGSFRRTFLRVVRTLPGASDLWAGGRGHGLYDPGPSHSGRPRNVLCFVLTPKTYLTSFVPLFVFLFFIFFK